MKTGVPSPPDRGPIQSPDLPEFPKISVAGLPVHVATRAETLDYVKKVIEQKATCRHGFLNAAKVAMAHHAPELFQALKTCDLISPDGISIVWASRFLGTPLPERVNGTNLMLSTCALAAKEGFRVYLLGGTPDVVTETAAQLRRLFPGLMIAGQHHGYFDVSGEPEIAQAIRDTKPDIVFVGISTPKKEFWLERNVPVIEVPFAMGVGGSFDIIAGRVRRAPIWMQERGLEWIWRLAQEPRKMWRRYLLGNPQFVWLILQQWWDQRKS